MTHVLVAGVSVRAAAESAARAGFVVTAIDAFADRDQHPAVRALSVPRDFGQSFTASHAARAAGNESCEAVAYLSPFENHPHAVQALARGRILLGNPPSVLRRVRDPRQLEQVLRARALPALWTSVASSVLGSPNGSTALVKPLRSGGGHRIRRWTAGERLPRGSYLQEYAAGVPGSIVFVANGRTMVPLGLTRQLIGLDAFAATGFRYCGSIVTAEDAGGGAALFRSACEIARALVEEFGVVGLNGVDFIERDGTPHAIEVNPRWTGSTELFERLHDTSIFRAHADACVSGIQPRLDPARAVAPGAIGKAIVFARHAVTIGDTQPWLADADIRDVPHAGERIDMGQPVCTVFASGRDAASCLAALEHRAAELSAQLTMWGESGAR